MVYSLFSCHKCTCWSHPILTFITFHEIDFATNVPALLFTRNIFGSWLYLLMPFYYRHDCRYTYAEFGMNCLNHKWNIIFCCVSSLLRYINLFNHFASSKQLQLAINHSNMANWITNKAQQVFKFPVVLHQPISCQDGWTSEMFMPY